MCGVVCVGGSILTLLSGRGGLAFAPLPLVEGCVVQRVPGPPDPVCPLLGVELRRPGCPCLKTKCGHQRSQIDT